MPTDEAVGRDIYRFQRFATCDFWRSSFWTASNWIASSGFIEDLLRRTLLGHGWDVVHVMNITDVGHMTSDGDTGEDKMAKAAARCWWIAAASPTAPSSTIRAI